MGTILKRVIGLVHDLEKAQNRLNVFRFMRWLFRGGHKKRQKERLRKTKFIRFKDPRDRRHRIPHGTT